MDPARRPEMVFPPSAAITEANRRGGLDNISAFERGVTPPLGGYLEQADGTGRMGFFALNMLKMALELGKDDPAGYDDLAVEFFDQFTAQR